MKVKVKICGVRSLEAAKTAITSGADFIGLNFIPTSKRRINLDTAASISAFAKEKISVVGVFQNAPFETVNKYAEKFQLDCIQLHGDEDADYLKKIKLPVIKSISDIQKKNNIQAQYLLLDRKIQGQGRMVDFALAKIIAEEKQIFFAGGLTPENIISVIQMVKPYAVDVASGVETDGYQDLGKIKQFIRNSKEVNL